MCPHNKHYWQQITQLTFSRSGNNSRTHTHYQCLIYSLLYIPVLKHCGCPALSIKLSRYQRNDRHFYVDNEPQPNKTTFRFKYTYAFVLQFLAIIIKWHMQFPCKKRMSNQIYDVKQTLHNTSHIATPLLTLAIVYQIPSSRATRCALRKIQTS